MRDEVYKIRTITQANEHDDTQKALKVSQNKVYINRGHIDDVKYCYSDGLCALTLVRSGGGGCKNPKIC